MTQAALLLNHKNSFDLGNGDTWISWTFNGFPKVRNVLQLQKCWTEVQMWLLHVIQHYYFLFCSVPFCLVRALHKFDFRLLQTEHLPNGHDGEVTDAMTKAYILDRTSTFSLAG
jgi:hypothetical protein